MQGDRRVLEDPRLNKGTAFTEAERRILGIEGMLPEMVETPELQIRRCRLHLESKSSDLDRYIYLTGLQDLNERLFYQLLERDIQSLMPIVYTPTVGEACQKFAHIMRQPRGLFVSLSHRGRVKEILRNWPETEVRVIVVTDGERILGLGDLGVGGIGIPIGKLALYTACAGVPPHSTLPVVLDVGTNNDALLTDPLYPGLRRRRAEGTEYDDFVEEFVMAVQEVFPHACIQFEDFTNRNATPLLQRFRDRVSCFNDDIQGTAAVAVAGLFAACRIQGTHLRDHRYLFFGAGSAATGIAELCCLQMTREGLSRSEALARCSLMNSKGLVTHASAGLLDHQQPFAHEHAPEPTLLGAVRSLRPSVLIGVSTVAKAFDRPVIEAMTEVNERPIIFPYSNPTSRSECSAREAIEWSGGRAIFASGSPFPPLHHEGKLFVPGQGNNVYIYPAVGLAVYATVAARVTDEMFLRAAEALAAQVSAEDLAVGLIYPPIAEIRRTSVNVAVEVAKLIIERGLARAPGVDLANIEGVVRRAVWSAAYDASTRRAATPAPATASA
ncbi:MAG: NAD-dependent malic enzyme [Phycisphaeraceae bacterium]|nr:NAD-dependent malic enzyme [Phycisphaeraceae bacterium]